MLNGEDQHAACVNCMFAQFVQDATDESGPVKYGYCRRNPPTPLLKTSAQAPKVMGGPPQIVHQIEPSYAPITSRMWCGEHMTPAEYLEYKTGAINDETGQVEAGA